MLTALQMVLFMSLGLAFEPSATSSPTAPQCERLGDAVVEHVCVHARFGPFGETSLPYPLAASERETFEQTAPNVNAPHTLHVLTLPAGSPGAHAGTVKWTPPRNGRWALFLTGSPPVERPVRGVEAPAPSFASPVSPVRLLDSAERPLVPELSHALDSCDGRLPFVLVWSLAKGDTLRIALGPSASSTVGLALEHVDEFEQFFFADADRDGFGDPNRSIVTACAPPTGFVENDTDCDDTSASRRPDAVGQCRDLGPIADASADPGDAGVSEAAAPAGAGSAIGAPSQDAAIGPSASRQERGCSYTPHSENAGSVMMALLLALLVRRRRT